ncbi:MAG: helix-turn-helix domain-containing protein [Ectobacillus sp.]
MKNRIKEIRKKNGDTLKSLAEKINYDYSNLSKIERGIYTPSLNLLKKIADVYGVEITHFLETENDSYTPQEKCFMQDLNLESEEILKRYNLILDGKKITKEEMEFMLDIVRKLRNIIQKQRN